MFLALAGLATNVVMGALGASSARKNAQAQAETNLKLTEAQVAGQNKDRISGNIVKAAQGNLARFMTAENNKRVLDNAAKQQAAGVQTMLRVQDDMTSGNLETQVRAAERAGAFTANAAFNGAGGNAVDIIDMTMRLKESRSQAAREKTQGYVNYDSMAQIAGIMPQAAESLDQSTFSEGMDNSVSLVSPQQGYNGPSAAQGALQGLLGSGFLKDAAQQAGQWLKPTAPTALTGPGLSAGGVVGGFKAPASQSFNFNNASSGVSYRLLD